MEHLCGTEGELGLVSSCIPVPKILDCLRIVSHEWKGKRRSLSLGISSDCLSFFESRCWGWLCVSVWLAGWPKTRGMGASFVEEEETWGEKVLLLYLGTECVARVRSTYMTNRDIKQWTYISGHYYP